MKRICIILPLLGLILSACAYDVSTTFFVQDVADLVKSHETIYANATFAIEFSGEEEEYQQATEYLSGVLLDAGNFRQEERNNKTYLLVDYKTPLIYANAFEDIATLPDTQNNVFTIIFLQETGKLNAYMTFNQSLFDTLNTQAKEQFDQSVALAGASIYVTLRNDLSESVSVTVFSAYANDVPVPGEKTLLLEKQDDVELKFSDVLRDSLGVTQETDSPTLHIRKFAEIVLPAQ